MSGCVNQMDSKGKQCGRIKVGGSDFCAKHVVSMQNCCSYRRESGKLITCGKMKKSGSDMCPHHIAVIEDENAERELRSKARKEKLAIKKEIRDSLKDSPLRGYNPEFDEKLAKKNGMYSL